MMVGIVMLVYIVFDCVEQVVCYWVKGGCLVIIYVDKKVEKCIYDCFVIVLVDVFEIWFLKCYICEWGIWGIVVVIQIVFEMMLMQFLDVLYVYFVFGFCLLLCFIFELKLYLQECLCIDFIESVIIVDVLWIVGGLDEECFIMWFLFLWKKNCCLFDIYVDFQCWFKFCCWIFEGFVLYMGL